MFRCYVLLFLLTIGAGISAQNSASLTYDVEMILPDEMAQFTYMTGCVEDPKGFLWISSHKGLSCFDGHKLIHYNNQYTADSIFLSDQGTGYKPLVTNDNGLHLWTVEHGTGRVVVFNTKERIISRVISPRNESIAPYLFSSFGHIYVIHEIRDSLEVSSFTNDKFVPRTIAAEEIHMIVDHSPKQQLAYTKKHVISVNEDGKLIKEDKIESAYQRTIDSVAAFADLDKWVEYHMVLDGRLLLTDRLRNLLSWDMKKKEVENYGITIDQLAQEVAQNTLKGSIQATLQASDGSIYILYSNSLIRLKTKLPKDEDFAEPINSGKPITSMRQITEDASGNIYASFYMGVAVKPKGSNQFSAFRNTLSVPKDKEATYSLTCYKDQLIWNCSVYDLESDAQSFIHYPFHGAHVNHYLEQDTLWMSFWFTKEWVKHVLTTGETITLGEIQGDFIYCSSLQQDKEGSFWISTEKAGILKIDRLGKIIRQYDIQELGLKLEADYLYGLYLKDDQVYFGSQVGLGVLNLSTNKTEFFDIPHASDKGKFLSRNIYFILPNNNGQLYLGTDHGLVLFNPETSQFKTLVEGHPLADKEFNRNSSYKASDGRFYVGTVNGLYSFLPEDLSFKQDIEQVSAPTIYEFHYYDGKQEEYVSLLHNWSDKNEIHLGPADRNFSLSFSSPFKDDVYYSYRVVGLQDEWSSLSPEGRMDIYSLPAGQFSVELKAQNSPSNEAIQVTSLSLIKSEFWYLTWWARGLLFAFLGLAIFFFFRNRYQRKLSYDRKVQHLRTKISSDLHDDVGSLLGGLAIQSELMAKVIPENYKPKLSEMSDMSREAMELMRDTVWALDARKDRFKNLIDRMRVFAEKSFGRMDIEFTFDSDELMEEQTILPDMRQHIYLLFKEAVTNIVKHSDAKHVDLSFKKKGDHIQLRIHDDGSSLEDSDMGQKVGSDGQGISNMKMRAEKIGGKLIINRHDGYEVILEIGE